jgi:3'-phosphoadenosine 5'-phosphosulfate sulfotransferase (PAPS reductase)/FAD synthetase
MREVTAEFKKPVTLCSIGEDSSVMLHIALKAFHPAPYLSRSCNFLRVEECKETWLDRRFSPFPMTTT